MTTTLERTPTLSPTASTRNNEAARRGQFWRTVWRVHFYAGMLVIPFLLMLAVTGTLILYEDPINNLTDSHLHQVTPDDNALALDSQVAAVKRVFPGAEVRGITPSAARDESTMIALAQDDGDTREVYVDPYTGDVIGSKTYHDDLPGLARKLHGNLLWGWKLPMLTLAGLTGEGPLTTPVDVGDVLIELMVCWGVVLIVSGLYLWWPRKRETNKALFRPRLSKRGRARWRDLHAVPGALLSVVLLFLIVSGMPWSGFWGGNWDHLTNQSESTVAAMEPPSSGVVRSGDLDRFGNPIPWATHEQIVPSSVSPNDGPHEQHQGHEAGHRKQGEADSQGGHEGHDAGSGSAAAIQGQQEAPAPLALDDVAKAARAEGMVRGFSIALPVNGETADGTPTYGSYTVTNPFTRTATERTIFVDQFTGETIHDHGFDDYSAAAKATAWAVDVHMGTEYGIVNRIVMTLACVLVVWSIISGLIMWWKRRPHGKAGLPRRPVDARLQRGLVVVAGVLGVLFPLVGVSMIAVVVLDRFVIRRVPALRRAFGMR